MSNVPSAALADPGTTAALHRDLRRWYRRHRRDLPWRRTRDPYRIWVSEIMLQQTQVATALPFYQSFIERFPTLEDLARARPADVLAAWSGLGYYRRARHLHGAARLVVRDHGAKVPSSESTFGALPGVGRYTVGAVLSIAFDRALPVLDGNVARVLSRLAARRWSVREPSGSRALWRLAEQLVPARGAGDWNQALMELGARICTPRAPTCTSCPIRRHCSAHARGTVDRYPPVATRKPTERVHWAAVIVRRGKQVLMTRRRGALLAGMWEPPIVEVPKSENAAVPPSKLMRALRTLGVRATLTRDSEDIRHRITHRDIRVTAWTGVVSRESPRAERREGGSKAADLRWVDPARPGVALTGVARKLMRASGARRGNERSTARER